jgi:transposase
MIIDLPIRLIQKNNQKKYILFPKCKNTLECYFKNNIKKSFIVKYYQSHYDLFLRKFVDKIYIDFTIYNNFEGIKKQELKIFNIVNDLQWKVCHLLLEKYNKILIPRLYVRSCSKIRRELQADMRHCTFVNRLIYKSIYYKNTEIHCCKEHGTSMTCTNCGSTNTIKNDIVKCLDCEFEIHRDLSGARNILVKHLQ